MVGVAFICYYKGTNLVPDQNDHLYFGSYILYVRIFFMLASAQPHVENLHKLIIHYLIVSKVSS